MTEEFLYHIGEYVGANERLNLEKYGEQISPFVRSYENLYRVWRYSLDEVGEGLSVGPFSYLATAKSSDAISALIDEADLSDGLVITLHSGEGFEPLQILREGLRQFPTTRERRFLEQTIATNEYQKEVILLSPLPTELNPSDIDGVVEDGSIDFF